MKTATNACRMTPPSGPRQHGVLKTAWARQALDIAGQQDWLHICKLLLCEGIFSHVQCSTTMAAVFGDNGDEVDGETMIDK